MPDLDAFLTGLDTMTGADATGLAVDADLRLELTTVAGASSTAWVTGHGQQIRVQVQRPEALLAAMERADVGRVADLLAATGITVTVHGPGGPVATLGAGTSNWVGRAVTGSRRVAPVPLAALRLAWASRPVRMASLALPVALTVLAAIRSLRRHTRSTTGSTTGSGSRPDHHRSRRR